MSTNLKIESGPMLTAGTQASSLLNSGVGAGGVNRQPNAAGTFRIVKSLNEVKSLARKAVTNLVKNFSK